jgi:hypothetical protein
MPQSPIAVSNKLHPYVFAIIDTETRNGDARLHLGGNRPRFSASEPGSSRHGSKRVSGLIW